MSRARRRASRVALLQPYWDFFESSVPGDLRADRAALREELAALLPGELCAAETIDNRESGAAAAARIAAAEPDALVVAVTMAAPPAFALAALDELPDLPLVVLLASRRSSYSEGYSHSDVTAEGSTVGGAQLTSSLHRRGRPHETVVLALDRPEDAQRLGEAVTAACAAGRLRRARIGRVGKPIDGYDCVECDPAVLRAATGIELVDLGPGEVRDAFLAAPPQRVEAVRAETGARFALAPGLAGSEGYERSLKLAAALEQIDERLALDAGAMNCHVPEIRFADGAGPGQAPCFALGRETSAGIPWSCAGDVPTAVAMLATTLLGGAAVYHEIEGLDRASGEALLANSGEHDLAFADPARRPALIPNRWWEQDPCNGCCACFGPAPGPATLVGFTPHPAALGGFRFVCAEGEFTSRALPETGTVNAAFRFAGEPDVAASWRRWAASGVNHHGVATPGHLGDRLTALAAHLGLECVRVGES